MAAAGGNAAGVVIVIRGDCFQGGGNVIWQSIAPVPAARTLENVRKELRLAPHKGQLCYETRLITEDEVLRPGVYTFYSLEDGSSYPYSQQDWEELICGKLFGPRDAETQSILSRVLQLQLRHPWVVGDIPVEEALQLLGEQIPKHLGVWFHTLCGRFGSGLRTFKAVLSQAGTELHASWTSSSSSQSSKGKYGHPAAVEVWDDFHGLVQECLTSLPQTRSMFPSSTEQMSQAGSGEAACNSSLNYHVFEPVNMLLRFMRYKHLGVTQDSMLFEWQQYARQTRMDSQNEHSADSGSDEEEFNKAAYAREQLARRNNPKVQGHALRRGKERKTVMLYETKRPEVLDPLANYNIQQLVDMWCSYSEPSQQHCFSAQALVDIISQVTEYAAIHGCKFVMFGSYRWNWAGTFTTAGHLKLAGPFRCTAEEPTLLQVVYTLSSQAIQEKRHKAWTPLRQHPNSGGRSNDNRCSRRGSRRDSEPDREGPSSTPAAAATSSKPSSSVGRAQQQQPLAGRKRPNQGSSQHKKNKAGADAVSVTASEQLQPRDQLPSSLPIQDKATDVLAAAAAAAETDDVVDVIGHGISGDVFLLRLSGTLAAVKLAFLGTEAAAALAHEGKMLLALQPLWSTYVPPLIALGEAFGQRDFILATEYVCGRHLRPAIDAHLLPQLQEALQAVHDLRVLHGDIRRQNIMVNEEQGKQRVWLIDFGYAKQRASKSTLADEMQQLADLFVSSNM